MQQKNVFQSMTVWGLLTLLMTYFGASTETATVIGNILGALLVLVGRYRKGDLVLGLPPKMALILPFLLLGACTTAQPLQKQADEAGRSDVRQTEYNEVQRTVLPQSIVYTFNGNVGDVILIDQGIEGGREGDIGAGINNQGSTTTETAKTGTQDGKADGADVDADVSGLPK